MRLPASRPLRLALLVFVLLVLALAAYLLISQWQRSQRARAPIPAALLDIAPIRLAQPDAMVVSSKLRALPADLLSVPALKAVLTEDFLFYYEDNDTLLGLKGTLRRIAYEHHLSLGDEIVALALDQPADIAFWRGKSGKLSHWMLVANRNDWTQLLQFAAQVVTSDQQLSQAGTLPLVGGGTTPIYKLTLSARQTLFFAGNGDKMVVFSDAEMIDGDAYGDADQHAKVWQALLDTHWQASPLRRHFGLDDFHGKHTIVAETAYLSFNYQQFFPAVEALRFDFDGKQWASYARLAGGTPAASLDTRALWAHVPSAASMCTAMPLDPHRLAPVIAGTSSVKPLADPDLFSGLVAPVGLCWYPEGGLYSPLLVARVDTRTSDAALERVFDAAIGNVFAKTKEASTPDVPAAPVRMQIQGAAHIWHRPVTTDFGKFDVTMARQGDWLAFSPQAPLVQNALAVMDKRRPALADAWTDDARTVQAVLTPRTLSMLLEQAVLGSLPQKTEPILRDAAQNRLLPRLKALAAFPSVALTLPSSPDVATRAWQPIVWQTEASH